jgi:hypothetical protein
LLKISIDFHDPAILYDDARIRSALITDAIEHPTAADNQLSFLPLRPLGQNQLWNEQGQYHYANQSQGSFHAVTS